MTFIAPMYRLVSDGALTNRSVIAAVLSDGRRTVGVEARCDKTRALSRAMMMRCCRQVDMSESLCLKTVYDLRVDASDNPLRYHIPAYQRGYRWTPRR